MDVSVRVGTHLDDQGFNGSPSPLIGHDTTMTNCSLHNQAILWAQQAEQSCQHVMSLRRQFAFERGGLQTISEDHMPHPQMASIVRQVEYYFSDENLPHDAHLLSLTGEFGDGWVSLNLILSFRKMRGYKPRHSVKAALAHSTKLEIWRNKLIRRRDPLQVPLQVVPRQNVIESQAQQLVDKPWLTKGLLKPTGFEPNYMDPPLRPEEYSRERELFDPEEAFVVRIESAVTRFCSRRKFHQHAHQVFTKFLTYGGFDAGCSQFTGKLSKTDLEELDKDEREAALARFTVSESVWDSLGSHTASVKWVVDFEGMARAFMSCEFFIIFDWKNQQIVRDTVVILRNFYSWLRFHEVCPEYDQDLQKSLVVCERAETELPKLSKVDDCLPGAFNKACSVLHNGEYASKRPIDTNADWFVEGDDQYTLSEGEAWKIFISGMVAYHTQEQIDAAVVAAKNRTAIETLSREEIGLEIVSVEPATSRAKAVYEQDGIKATEIKAMGRLTCKRWTIPSAAPRDLEEVSCAHERQNNNELFDFLLEEDALEHFVKGMKFEATVGESRMGLKWIDARIFVYPSFYLWTQNERLREWRESKMHSTWKDRQNAKDSVEDDVEAA